MKNKDYYAALGVSETASEAEIKKIYRKLAIQYHPDKNKGSKQSEAKFKELSEAYYVLGDKKRRAEYDQMRKYGFSGQNPGANYAGAQGFDFDELLRNMGRGKQQGRAGAGQYSAFSDIFEDLFSGGGGGSFRTRSYSSSKPSASPYGGYYSTDESEEPQVNAGSYDADTTVNLRISADKAKSGGKVSFTTPEGKTISVNVPAGIKDGQKLRLTRQGKLCPSCRHEGDLILKLKIGG